MQTNKQTETSPTFMFLFTFYGKKGTTKLHFLLQKQIIIAHCLQQRFFKYLSLVHRLICVKVVS